MKYIFLDIDGVLNNANTVTKSPDGYIGVSSNLGKRLSKIVKATDASVVLTSSWKNCSSEQDHEYLVRKLKMYSAAPVAQTHEPNDVPFQRGAGINAFLKDNPCDQFVILDDFTFDFKEEGLFPHLVLTNPEKGLTKEDVITATAILNGKLLSEDAYNELLMQGYHR